MKSCYKYIFYPFAFIVIFFFSCKKINNANIVHSVSSWEKILPDTGVAYSLTRIAGAADGGLYIPYSDQKANSYLIKLDINGNREWKVNTNYLAYTEVLQLSDNSIILAGSDIIRNNYIRLYKISANGKFNDSAEIQLTSKPTDPIYSLKIIPASGGDYMIYGSYNANSIYTCIVGSNLGKVAEDTFNVAIDARLAISFYPTGIQSAGNNKYIMVGAFISQISLQYISKFGYFTCVLNANGAKESTGYTITGTINNSDLVINGYAPMLGDLYQDGTGKYVTWLSPQVINSGLSFTDMSQRLIWFDSTGKTINTVNYATQVPTSVTGGTRENNGGFLLTGNAINNSSTSLQVQNTFNYFDLINKEIGESLNLSEQGAITQAKSPETILSGFFGSCCNLSDGHYAIQGYVQEYGSVNLQLVIIKTDEDGNY